MKQRITADTQQPQSLAAKKSKLKQQTTHNQNEHLKTKFLSSQTINHTMLLKCNPINKLSTRSQLPLLILKCNIKDSASNEAFEAKEERKKILTFFFIFVVGL